MIYLVGPTHCANLHKLPSMNGKLTVALVSDVFFGPGASERLDARLREAKKLGAELVVLPEIALLPWSPATREARAEDAERPGGPRARLLMEAARRASISVLGGLIELDDEGRRFNVALLADSEGAPRGSYRKVHLPEEPGFWETSHYLPGTETPRVLEVAGFPFGVQICSDSNRPVLTHALTALGAEAILAPRATERETWESWKLVYRANALTACAYVLTVNRPAPEQGVPLGGPSFACGPDGAVLVETTDPVALVTLDRAAIARARKDYPGYLATPSALYRDAWASAAKK